MAVYEDLESVYAWVDDIPLSRTKRNLTRDFSDGVLMAEVCKHLFPKIVDLHNYPAANSHAAKVINWETLNRKVFSKLEIRITSSLIQQIAAGVPGALESVLLVVKRKVDSRRANSDCLMNHLGIGNCGDSDNCEDVSDDVGIINEIKKLKSEVQVKNEAIGILNKKVSHLENLMKMKDKRLKELADSVERLQAKSEESTESFRTVSA